jgi:hypothetical protein
MLVVAKKRDLETLQETIKAAGAMMDLPRFKQILRQSRSLLDEPDWFWLETAIKALHFTPENPRKTLYTRYLRPPLPESAKLSAVVHVR